MLVFTAVITVLGVAALTVLWKQRSKLPDAANVATITSAVLFLLGVITGTKSVENCILYALLVVCYWALVYLVWRNKNAKQQ